MSHEDYLLHFGVKGMKWGVRKDRSIQRSQKRLDKRNAKQQKLQEKADKMFDKQLKKNSKSYVKMWNNAFVAHALNSVPGTSEAEVRKRANVTAYVNTMRNRKLSAVSASVVIGNALLAAAAVVASNAK